MIYDEKMNEHRYVDDKPLPPPAARRLAEREAAERKRGDWLDVNIHKTWVENPHRRGISIVGAGSGGGDGAQERAGAGEANGGGEFGRATGREKVG